MEIARYQTSDYIDTPEMVVAYLNDVLRDGDLSELLSAIRTVARSEGMTKIAREAGINRESLYRSLSPNGNPSFETVRKVMAACGYRLAFERDEERELASA